MSQTYQISTNALIGHITSLRLQKGDCLLVTHEEALRFLEHFKNPYLNFLVPIIFAPHGGITRLTRQDLLNLLEQTDTAQATEPSENHNAPL